VVGVPLKPFDPDELEDFEKEQAGRIRGFLKRLAKNDKLLLNYINDRVVVLQNEVKAKRLTNEDVSLLLDSDYTRIYEVMSQGSQPMRWIIIWII
jgi:hypothetical protein